MIGTLIPLSDNIGFILEIALADSTLFTVTLTISDPALYNSSIWFTVLLISDVSVSVID